MLDPHHRAMLLDSLRPPEGHRVDRALATTFSIDLLAALTAPLAFSMFDQAAAAAEEGKSQDTPLALLHAVREHADRLSIFCEAGRMTVPIRLRRFLAYLEPSIVEVKAPREGALFHPKIWVLRFTAKDDATRYRLLCLTRNLTFDESWDTMLQLEGELTDRKNAFSANRPLFELIRQLPDMAIRPVSDRIRQDVALVADELLRVRFEVPQPFKEMRFIPLGIPGASDQILPRRVTRSLVISPFVEEERLRKLSEPNRGDIVIACSDQLDRVDPEVLRAFEHRYVLAETASPEEDGAGHDDGENLVETERPTGLHAKLYVIESGKKVHVLTGSANATEAGFSRNVELVVELVGSRHRCGIASMLGVEGDKENPGLLRLLRDYKVLPEARRDDEREGLEWRLERARQSVARLSMTARVERVGSTDDVFDLRLEADGPIAIPEGVNVRIWPVTVGAAQARALEASDRAVTLPFGRASFEAITSFFAVEVRSNEPPALAVRFVVNVPLVGAPASRRARLIESILGDAEGVMRFLRLLLADGSMDLAEAILAPHEGGASGSGGTRSPDVVPLLEGLVRTFECDPERLEAIDRFVKELESSGKAEALLPPAFQAIWQPIWSAHEARRRVP